MSFLVIVLSLVVIGTIYLFPGLVLFLLITGGVGTLYFSISNILFSPSWEEINAKNLAMSRWPSLTGELSAIYLQSDPPHGRSGRKYRAEADYRYTVDNSEYIGHQVGIDEIEDRSPDDLELRLGKFFSPRNIVNREKTENESFLFGSRRIAIQFEHQPIKVYYDPQNPQASLLDPIAHRIVTRWDAIAPHLFLFPFGIILIVVPLLKLRGDPPTAAAPKPSSLQQPPACTATSEWYDWLAQGEYQLQQGQYELAIASLDKSEADNPCEAGTWPSSIKAAFLKTECLVALGRTKEAKTCFDKACYELGNSDIPWLQLAQQRAKALLENNSF